MDTGAEFESNNETSLERNFIRRAEERFSLAFGEVLEENKPDIGIEEYFSYHNTPEDLEGLNERIREGDIYIPEVFGWRPRDLELLRSASSGEITLEDLRERLKDYSPVFSKTSEDVYGSHKAIDILDVPDGHELKNESDEAWNYNPSYEGDFPEVLNYTRTYLDNVYSHLNRRDEYMLSQITPEKVRELLEAYPDLRNNQSIKILLSLGLGHSLVPPDFPENSFTDQGIITRRLGREVDDELAAKIFLESFINMGIDTGYPSAIPAIDYRSIAAMKRRAVGQLNFDDARRTFNSIKNSMGRPL